MLWPTSNPPLSELSNYMSAYYGLITDCYRKGGKRGGRNGSFGIYPISWGKRPVSLSASDSGTPGTSGRPSTSFKEGRLLKSGAIEASHVVRDVTTKSPSQAIKFISAMKVSEVALSSILEFKLTVAAYLNQRKLAIPHNAPIYPSYHKVLDAKKRCYPSGIGVTETSAEVKLQELLDHTSDRILLAQEEIIDSLDKENVAKLTLIVKWGCEGSSG
ncbi:unnamed protein product [Brassicogethes aeneus]|uniref:Uncharacterized protein n=1 Tax=Brassicogethes aeneus TaxID=1431903 RepID=A0A9P0BDU7_BRAAE|nr:unnamed protein product [Brassicogethes aeneus]